MRKRISRTMAVIVVSALMVVLTAGVAFAATVNCPQGGSFDGVCQGTNDADHLYGSNNDDEIYALGGDDHVYAFDGNDQLIGGDGNDVAIGYLGDDRIWGEAGNDHLILGPGNDVAVGEEGNDTIVDVVGRDFAIGGGGGDTIDVKDNTPGDKVDCGDARDRVSADSGDIVFANCEVVR